MKTDTILLDNGGGGKMSHRLVADLLLPTFGNSILSELYDGAVLEINGQRLAFSTDTFVVILHASMTGNGPFCKNKTAGF